MKTPRSTAIILTLLASFLVQPLLQGQVFCSDPRCAFDRWCGDITLGAEALYWKPMAPDLFYASRDTDEQLEALDLTADSQWGFRIFAGYDFSCFYSQLSYAWLQVRNATRPQDDVSPDLPRQAFLANQVIARIGYDYENVNWKVGRSFHKGSGRTLDLFTNFRWVRLAQRRRMTGTADPFMGPGGDFESNRKAVLQAVGLGVGLTGEFALCYGLGAFGEFNIMGLLGDRQTPLHKDKVEITPTTERDLIEVYQSKVALVPATDVRLGLNYCMKICAVSLLAEIGYEVNQYWNAIEQTPGSTILVRECRDLGFAGPYLKLRLSF